MRIFVFFFIFAYNLFNINGVPYGFVSFTVIIIPRVRVGYELAIIISYPTSASVIIVLLKKPTKYLEFLPTLFVKTTDFKIFF